MPVFNVSQLGGKLKESIDEKTRVSFRLGFFVAIIGAVVTATTLYTQLSEDNKTLKAEQREMREILNRQSEAIIKLQMGQDNFLRQYDLDMNRYFRDRRETTTR